MTGNTPMQPHLILFVDDQAASARFYASVLDSAPTLDVPGMTEFELGAGCVLGLMPRSGARKVLSDANPSIDLPATGSRHELYLYVEEPREHLTRALTAGAKLASELQLRSWGDEAAYCLDPDGHLLAFARKASRDSVEDG